MKRLKKFELIRDDSEGELPDGDYIAHKGIASRTIVRKRGTSVLSISRDNSTLGHYCNPSECRYLFRIKGDRLVPPTPKPRVWQRIEDVPEGVVVERADRTWWFKHAGDYFQVAYDGNLWRYVARQIELVGPFTATGYRVEIEFGECDD